MEFSFHTSQTAVLLHTRLYDTMKNNSYHVVGEMLILEVFMEPTHAHLSATICQTATQNSL
jgi:hypothetical protein